jgi:hypothetical protein
MACNLAAMAILLAATSLAQAQATRTWVSGVGDDANPCSRTAPCKTFAGAIAKTAPGGEIDVLDPGGFGALTITKSIKIEADGVIAGVLVSGTNGFVIQAGPTDVVEIRGLTFNGLGTGLAGIKVNGAGVVHIEECYIYNFTQIGIDFSPSSSTPGSTSQLHVRNTVIKDNVGTSSGGIRFKPGTNVTGSGEIHNCKLADNQYGLRVEDNSNLTVDNTQASGNVNNGFLAFSAGGATNLTLESCITANNGIFPASAAGAAGLQVNGAAAVAFISNVTISGNALGLSPVSGGTIRSGGNNHNRDSGAPNGAAFPTQ